MEYNMYYNIISAVGKASKWFKLCCKEIFMIFPSTNNRHVYCLRSFTQIFCTNDPKVLYI